MNKAVAIILFIIVVTAIAVPIGMLANPDFKNLVVNSLSQVSASIGATVGNGIAVIQANSFYQAYVGPYLIWYGLVGGIILTLVFQHWISPKVPAIPLLHHKTPKTVAREEPRDVIMVESPSPTKAVSKKEAEKVTQSEPVA